MKAVNLTTRGMVAHKKKNQNLEEGEKGSFLIEAD